MIDKIKQLSFEINDELKKIRRYIHKNPEIGFNLDNTLLLVRTKLKEYGYTPIKCGKSGVYVDIGQGDKTILFRADMDALDTEELTDLEYKSSNSYMHACGHDMHTAMLLGCAKVLKKIENELTNVIRLVFQPAEEILKGAVDMIEDDLLEPKVDYAVALHVLVATNLKSKSIMLAPIGVSAPSSDMFEIDVIGLSSHGAMPQLGIDPIITASNIVLALQSIVTKDVSFTESSLVNITSINGGSSYNLVPNVVVLKGTLRTYNENVRTYLKQRIENIVSNICLAYKSKYSIRYISGCPTLINDKELYDKTYNILKENYHNYLIDNNTNNEKNTASEDFSYISHKVKSLLITLSAGSIEEGYTHPLHNSKAVFNDDVLYIGTSILCLLAYLIK